MNLPDHLLTELADLERLAAKQFQLTEDGLASNAQNFQQTHHKLDEWIQTNRAISESNRNPLAPDYDQCRGLGGFDDLLQQQRQLMARLEAATTAIRTSNQYFEQLLGKIAPAGAMAPGGDDLLDQQQVRVSQWVQQLEKAVQVLPGRQQQTEHSRQLTMGKFPGLSLSIELVRRTSGPLAALGALLLMAGSGVGFAYAQVSQPPPLYVTDLQEPLTLEQATLLAWAKSQEGQFAKNLMDWNSGILDGGLACTKEVERLGVILKVQGRSASSGFCTVWVVPPNERRFVSPDSRDLSD